MDMDSLLRESGELNMETDSLLRESGELNMETGILLRGPKKELNIYQRMHYISSELNQLNKDIEIQSERANYRVASEWQVVEAVKPLEEKYGVFSYPANVEVVSSNVEKVRGATGSYLLFYTKIKLTYRFVNVENPSDYLEVQTFGTGTDFLDKEGGKALTYATKYALCKAYKILFSEDPDSSESKKVFLPHEKAEGKSSDTERKASTSPKKSQRRENGEPIITEKQRDYIQSLKKIKEHNPMTILEKFGYSLDDHDIPVSVANEIIQYLKGRPDVVENNKVEEDDYDDLPF